MILNNLKLLLGDDISLTAKLIELIIKGDPAVPILPEFPDGDHPEKAGAEFYFDGIRYVFADDGQFDGVPTGRPWPVVGYAELIARVNSSGGLLSMQRNSTQIDFAVASSSIGEFRIEPDPTSGFSFTDNINDISVGAVVEADEPAIITYFIDGANIIFLINDTEGMPFNKNTSIHIKFFKP